VAIFGRRRSPDQGEPQWVPNVDLEVARPVVFALADTPAMNDAQVRAALADFRRLAEAVPFERAVRLIEVEPDVVSRPWKWLIAAMRVAGARDEDHLVAAGLFWACYWTSSLVPLGNGNVGFFMELGIDPIPSEMKNEILRSSAPSVDHLPPQFIVAGEPSDGITADWLSTQAGKLLGV
jgi:hypothetical protein